MAFKLSKASLANLKGVHPDLVRVVKRAIKNDRVDFAVLEGRRSAERQADLFKRGATKVHHSRHQDGMAVDLGVFEDGHISWHWPEYIVLASEVKAAALAEKVPIVWGGDWEHFKDGPHFELARGTYPTPHE